MSSFFFGRFVFRIREITYAKNCVFHCVHKEIDNAFSPGDNYSFHESDLQITLRLLSSSFPLCNVDLGLVLTDCQETICDPKTTLQISYHFLSHKQFPGNQHKSQVTYALFPSSPSINKHQIVRYKLMCPSIVTRLSGFLHCLILFFRLFNFFIKSCIPQS